jgi:hypothetical protein
MNKKEFPDYNFRSATASSVSEKRQLIKTIYEDIDKIKKE